MTGEVTILTKPPPPPFNCSALAGLEGAFARTALAACAGEAGEVGTLLMPDTGDWLRRDPRTDEACVKRAGEKAPLVWLSASWLPESSLLCGEMAESDEAGLGVVWPRVARGVARAPRSRGVLRETLARAERRSALHSSDAPAYTM